MSRLLICVLAIGLIGFAGCSRKRVVTYTYFQLNVTEAKLDQHLQQIEDAPKVVDVHHSHDSSNKATIEVYVKEADPYKLKELMRDMGYTRVRD